MMHLNMTFSPPWFTGFPKDASTSFTKTGAAWQETLSTLNPVYGRWIDLYRQESEHTLVEVSNTANDFVNLCWSTLQQASQAAPSGLNPAQERDLNAKMDAALTDAQKTLWQLWFNHCERLWTVPFRLGQSAEGQKRFPVTLEGEWETAPKGAESSGRDERSEA